MNFTPPGDNGTGESSILTEMEKTYQEYLNIMERSTYMMVLYNTLLVLKENVGGAINQYYKIPHFAESLSISFTDGELGQALFSVFQPVFRVLKSSPMYYGSEYRAIGGVKLEEVNGINISSLGIPTTIPAKLNPENTSVAVSLGDIDALRINELGAISAMAEGNGEKIKDVNLIITTNGGMTLDPLFLKESNQ